MKHDSTIYSLKDFKMSTKQSWMSDCVSNLKLSSSALKTENSLSIINL